LTLQEHAPLPRLAQPWDGAVTGWLVVFGAVVADLVAAVVTNRAPVVVTASALAVPIAVVAGFAAAQWRQTRLAERASLWHLAGPAIAVFIWLVYPTTFGRIAPAASAPAACRILVHQVTADCLRRASAALDARSITWWLTGAAIVLGGALVRRSRIAAWATIPIALAGCALATHFVELLLRFYHAGG
jgi:hypothetical protein